MLIQSIFYPFAMYATRRDGIALQPAVEGPSYEGTTHGEVHTIDTSAIWNGQTLHVFATNRSVDETATVQVKVADHAITKLENADILTGPDAKAANSYENPNVVQAQPFADVQITDGQATLELPPLSVVALTFSLY